MKTAETTPNTELRNEVLEHIIDVMREAETAGLDAIAMAHRKLPDVPMSVLAEAWTIMDMRGTESWWQTVERTIDAQVIRNALAPAAER